METSARIDEWIRSEIDELRKILAEQQRVIRQLQRNQNPSSTMITEGMIGNFLHFTIRDALESVPNFDGGNIPFVYFVRESTQYDSVNARNNFRVIQNKLKSDAHRSILGKTFINM